MRKERRRFMNLDELAVGVYIGSIKLPEKIPNELLKAIDKAIKDNKKKKVKTNQRIKGK